VFGLYAVFDDIDEIREAWCLRKREQKLCHGLNYWPLTKRQIGRRRREQVIDHRNGVVDFPLTARRALEDIHPNRVVDVFRIDIDDTFAELPYDARFQKGI
jgi:hypothetical protein